MPHDSRDPLTYGRYLRVPELLELQTPLGPGTHGELLFIITQQSQELWFKQVLHEVRSILRAIVAGDLLEATHMFERVNRIVRVLSEEAEILETLPPFEFHRFRGMLKSASGFESEQFRELEIASGLRDDAYLRMVGRFMDIETILARWPHSLHDALLRAVEPVDRDPVRALVSVYADPSANPHLYLLCEAFSEYELRFSEWRFHHKTLVERVIGDRAPGTGGSPGSAYLQKTIEYRFFPELWRARNELTRVVNAGTGVASD